VYHGLLHCDAAGVGGLRWYNSTWIVLVRIAFNSCKQLTCQSHEKELR